MSTLYLHIGPPKTGTTTIQNFLSDNQEALSAHGICFPDLGYRYPGIDRHRTGHFLVRQRPHEGQKVSDFKKGLDKLQKLSLQYDSIILSDEGIWKDGIHMTRFWKRLLAELQKRQIDLRIIVYLRRQDLWVQSFWSQKIKVGKTSLDFQEFLRFLNESSYPLDYCAYMDMLSDIFGKDALIIRVMERGQFQGPEHSLVSDFLDIFGLSLSDGFIEQQELRNPKISGTYLEIKRMLNMLPWFQNTRTNSFTGSIRQVQEQNPFQYDLKGRSFFAPGEQKQFRDSFTESNSRLAKEYLGREDGILFREDEDELPAEPIIDKDLLRDTILVCGTILQSLKKRDAEQQQTIRALQKNLDSSSLEVNALSEKINALSQEVTTLSKKVTALSRENSSLKKSMEENSLKGRLRKIKKHLS